MAVDWPIAQAGIGVVPWVVSLWVHGPWQFVLLWDLGVTIDLAITLAMPWRHPERTGRGAALREARYREIVRIVTNPLVAGADAAHLTERLGLFVIIVLGEGVISAVQAASEVEWDRALLGVSLAAFGLLVSLWLVSIYGTGAAVPQLAAREFGIRVTLVWHFLSTGLIAAMAAGLGGLVEHPHGPAPTAVRWLLCASAAGYFALNALGGMVTGLPLRWLLGWGLPGVAVPLLVGLFGARLHPAGIVGLVALVCVWHANYMFRRRRRHAAEAEPA